MKIDGIIWIKEIEDKIWVKHHVEKDEVEQALASRPKFRFLEKGEREEEDIYMALGRTDAGRYLSIFFINKASGQALIISARDMMPRERKRYEKK